MSAPTIQTQHQMQQKVQLQLQRLQCKCNTKSNLDSRNNSTEMLDTLRKQLLVSWSLQCGSDEAHLKKLSQQQTTKRVNSSKNYEFCLF